MATARARRPATLLVGDIGGTRTRLALYDHRGRTLLRERIYPSREHGGFEAIARAFLDEAGPAAPPLAAVLGIAAPVRRGVAALTNLPWRIEERAIAKALGIGRVALYNDLVVAARGCLSVPTSQLVSLTEARPKPKGQNVAVIAAGTGLGEARLVWDGFRHVALGSEGGHGDFAAQGPLEIELWQFLSSRYPDHVSYERVLSGAGLGALYDFFLSRAGGREPRTVQKKLAEGDRNAVISELGLARAFRPAARAVDLFASIYGAEAGNLALRELATGGVFVVGNISRTIVPERRDEFMTAFRKKGRFSALMAEIPVAVVTDPLVGVRGALAIALEAVAETTG